MDADATAVRSLCSNRDEQEHDKIVSNKQEHEKIIMKDAASTIAIFKDREKDLSDPDYNRSYDRYSRGFVPCHHFDLGACNVHICKYLPGAPHFSQFPQANTSVTATCHQTLSPRSALLDAIKLHRILSTCSGLVLPWCVHTRMVTSGMPYTRQQSISNLATIELDRWQNRQITELYPPSCRGGGMKLSDRFYFIFEFLHFEARQPCSVSLWLSLMFFLDVVITAYCDLACLGIFSKFCVASNDFLPS